MKRLSYSLPVLAVVIAFSFSTFAQNDIGVTPYPNATEIPEATTRLLETKASTWIAVRAYRTDDSIKDVVKHFRQQAEKGKRPSVENAILQRLFEHNWRITKSTVRAANDLFITTKDPKTVVNKEAQTSFGTILLNDSLVRAHIMSPYPASPTGETVAQGTMIVLVREKLPDETTTSATGDEEEKVYSGREVTRKVRLITAPAPKYVGGTGVVVLRAVFGSSGKVTKIVVVHGVPGLTEEAVNAAKQITFVPAIKDGRNVAMWMQLEYNFN